MQALTLATGWGCSFWSFSFLTPSQSPEHTNVCHCPFPPLPSPSAATDLKAGAAFYNHSHRRSRKHTRTPSLPGHGPTSTPAGTAAMDKESSARPRATPPHPTPLSNLAQIKVLIHHLIGCFLLPFLGKPRGALPFAEGASAPASASSDAGIKRISKQIKCPNVRPESAGVGLETSVLPLSPRDHMCTSKEQHLTQKPHLL